ncbi:deoxyribose-phosphate aldolase [Spiroplasma clarkii]|uniref:Deoxyribose-phosphate aldolase n=1 Tax=Spiroplasma clarkii TaxID=2139 RepID=A0A1Y0L0W0_9MOLU|nr:deoxyribose-phosphate aldolase [Spiroplasma clarkii]ARU91616.1 deoxyribose-phosphate aldolase [Spiroplasma clarkii]ATX71010.1 deoxyribose-phosphate aldolase [Spiroplasma clarkii]
MKLNKYIDHTLLKPTATKSEIKTLCEEALKFDFATVCVNPCQIEYAASLLKGSDVGITTVIGFPLGATTSAVKAFETSDAIKKGATEIDMVVNIGAIKDQDWDYVLNDMKAVKTAAGKTIVKCIMENCLLEKPEIVKACELAVQAGLDFVKTSTGFSTGGATFEDVKLMSQTVNGKAQVKAAGGVRTYDDAMKMIENGATRLGTSGGVAIVQKQDNNSSY